MSKILLLTVLLSIPFAACADRAGSLVITDGPAAPINEPDTRVFDPTPGEPGISDIVGSETGTQSGGSGTSVSSVPVGGGSVSPTGGAGIPGSGSKGEPGGGGGGGGGGPVPEPGTLLLFGSGLAGLAGISLRRRRKEQS
jgi:hypothetical protein